MKELVVMFGEWLFLGKQISVFSGYGSALFVLDRFLLWSIRNFIVISSILLLFKYIFKPRYHWRKIIQINPSREDLRREITFGLLSIFSVNLFIILSLAYLTKKLGFDFKVYQNLSEHGLLYYCFSLLFILVAYDFHFYVVHRLLHTSFFFKKIHYIHHKSLITNPLTGISFHPFESMLNATFVISVLLLVPVHESIFVIFSWFSVIFICYGHCGWELTPSFVRKTRLKFFFNTPTHHSLHHEKQDSNFSLFFNIPDKIFGTNHPDYFKRLEDISTLIDESEKNDK